METIFWIQLITAISTAVIAVCGIFVAYFWGYVPRKRKEKIDQMQHKLNSCHKELLECYYDIYNLLQIEKDYMEENELSIKKVRKNRSLGKCSQPSYLEKRIKELEYLTIKNNISI